MWRRQDQPPGPLADQPLYRRLLAGGVAVAFADQQLRARLMRPLQRAEQDLAQIAGAGVGIQQADPPRPCPSQAARRRIGRIAQGRHRRRHRLAGRGLDPGLVVDHPGHRHGRHTGQSGDVTDRGDLFLAGWRRAS